MENTRKDKSKWPLHILDDHIYEWLPITIEKEKRPICDENNQCGETGICLNNYCCSEEEIKDPENLCSEEYKEKVAKYKSSDRNLWKDDRMSRRFRKVKKFI